MGREVASGGDVTVDAIGGVLVLIVSGDIDRACAAKLASCFRRAIDSQRPVVADLIAVTALAEEALEALKIGYSRLGTRLHLVTRRGDPAWTALRARGIAHRFIVHASRPSALTAAAPRV
jgi:hypothetical protein